MNEQEEQPQEQTELPIPSSKTKQYIEIGITVLAVLLFGGYLIFAQNNTVLTACTTEAKICSDGSSVGRTGPNCEFAECPVANTSVEKRKRLATTIDIENFANNLNLGPSNSKRFELRINEETNFGGSAYILTKDNDTAVLYSDAKLLRAGEVTIGNNGKISNNESLLAYVNLADSSVWVADTEGNKVTLTNLLTGTTTDAKTGINGWSPNDSRLLFSIANKNWYCETCSPYGIPDGILYGYHIADFERGEISHINFTNSTWPIERYLGWLDDERILFEKYDTLYEYDVMGSEMILSSLFGPPGKKQPGFRFIENSGDLYLIMVPTNAENVFGLQDLKLINKDGEKIITSSEWADIQPNDVYFSKDGQSVFYTRTMSEERGIGNYRYNITTDEIVKLSK